MTFIESLKGLVTTLTSMLVFIGAIEIIAPDNKMKKYIKFILGLILITVILNPILNFISNGEENILSTLSKYERSISNEEVYKENINVFNNKKNDNEAIKNTFIENFNKNSDKLLKDKFKNMTFKSEVECDVDFNSMSYDIKKLKIGINDNKVKKIEIGIERDNKREDSDEYEEVVDFISDELEISKEKIEIYELEG
ncbi:stage III sporulation protein AF [Clostridium neonatale]|uniref:Stage III sporulation protein AF n=1 Tax=Clostridium neonatale TaxID=137838 RepID=A0A650LUW6_9CLOT|nr:stage III sporulation protein AF [Clostridium neonatale]CAG9708563.1 Stage III sporulation protein AF [Clostridium neonatale]CAI3537558.1 stage III sporulation protein AF [Clostridium neonatale]CAI3543125.1 stage III sporulation protein AF [Clostridium neonatale]CAI3555313.1 stage III sporulation protein AF [Clostridium neonatale]CAI3577559.1 stage III sporulation protein AF [Clostridium neonatale]